MQHEPADAGKVLLYNAGFASRCVRSTIIISVLVVACLQPLMAQQPRGSGDHALKAIVFLAVDCPISQKYLSELNRIDSLYSPQLHLTGIIPGKVNPQELTQFRQEYKIRFPLETDENFESVKKFSATITPQVFLINDQADVSYVGAIDNWFFDLGNYRQQVTQYYLINAIESVLHGTKPEIAKTEAVGCPIQIPARYKARK